MTGLSPTPPNSSSLCIVYLDSKLSSKVVTVLVDVEKSTETQ